MKKILVDNYECLVIGEYNFFGKRIVKCLKDAEKIIFVQNKDESYYEIKNKLFLEILNLLYTYNIETDINREDSK